MKHIDFLQRMEEFKSYLYGHGADLAVLCGLSLGRYRNVVNGKIKDPATLKKVHDTIEKWLEAKLGVPIDKTVTIEG